jgi:hypothetical protein
VLPAAARAQAATFWAVETPADWSQKLLAPEVDFNGLARELITAALMGKGSSVTSISAHTLDADSGGFHREMEPRIFFGDYVNTAPAPKGIFFNPRTVYQVHVGLQTSTEGGDFRPCSIDEIGEPEWRHWGIWQPAVKGTNQSNSGVVQPIFPTTSLSVTVRGGSSPLQLLGVLKVAARTAPQPHPPPARLRWYLLQSGTQAAADAPPLQTDPRMSTVQAIVLKLPAALPEESRTAAALLSEAAAGRIPVLDFITLAKYFEGVTNAKVGNDYYFTCARSPVPGENWNIFKAPAQMPAGTEYADQILLRNRLVGFTLNLQENHWKIERDSAPPTIVTDTFPDAPQEWPGILLSRDEQPKVTVCVQRPIFTIEEHAGDLPAVGQNTMTSLSKDTVLIIRTLK